LSGPAQSAGDRSGFRLATRIPDWRRSGLLDFFHALLDSGKPTMADHTWPYRRGRKGHGRYRVKLSLTAARKWIAARPIACATFDAAAPCDGRPVPPASAPDAGGAEPDGVAGVFLQRNILHLCIDPHGLLRGRIKSRRLVYPAICDWKFFWTPVAWAFGRHARAQAHDRIHLHCFRNTAGAHGMPVLARSHRRDDPDDLLDGDFLLRLGSGELGLAYRQRNFPA